MLLRFFIYGLLGRAGEIIWTGLPKRRPIDVTLFIFSPPLVIPIQVVYNFARCLKGIAENRTL